MHPLRSPGSSLPAKLGAAGQLGREANKCGGITRAFATHYNLIYCKIACTFYISTYFFAIFATKETFMFASNKLPSVSCHCYIKRQTVVYTLRHSQVFHVLATWGVGTGSRAEKSQAVSPVTAMTGGG